MRPLQPPPRTTGLGLHEGTEQNSILLLLYHNSIGVYLITEIPLYKLIQLHSELCMLPKENKPALWTVTPIGTYGIDNNNMVKY